MNLSDSSRLKRAHSIFSFLVAGAALYYVATRLDYAEIRELLAGANLWWLVAGFLGFYLSLPLRALRWKILLRNLGEDAPMTTLSSAIFRGWFVNCALPGRAGDIYTALLLKEEKGLRMAISAGTILAARVLDLATLLVILLILFLSYFRSIVPPAVSTGIYIGAGFGLAVGIGLLALSGTRQWIIRKLPDRFARHFDDFVKATFSSMRRMPLLVLVTSSLWILEAFRLGAVLATLGSHPSLSIIFFLALSAAILTTVPLTPGGVGTVEGFYLKTFPLLGIGSAVAGGTILLDRFINYWFILLLGAIFSIGSRLRSRTP